MTHSFSPSPSFAFMLAPTSSRASLARACRPSPSASSAVVMSPGEAGARRHPGAAHQHLASWFGPSLWPLMRRLWPTLLAEALRYASSRRHLGRARALSGAPEAAAHRAPRARRSAHPLRPPRRRSVRLQVPPRARAVAPGRWAARQQRRLSRDRCIHGPGKISLHSISSGSSATISCRRRAFHSLYPHWR